MSRGDVMLSIDECYELYKKTLEECGSDILLEEEEVVAYKLFEEFATDAISFLHESLLDVLLDNGMIDNEIYEKSRELRKKYLSIEADSTLLNVKAVRTAQKWKELLILSDEIRNSLYW